jgi:dihydrofolate reductase
MGNVVVCMNLTFDGVMQAPTSADADTRDGFNRGGWAAPYGAMAQNAGAVFTNTGALLLGRRTYEEFYASWPRRPGNPFTHWLNAIPKYVASTTLNEPLPWTNSTLIGGDVVSAVAALKERTEKDVLVLGSGELVRSLMSSSIIDEWKFFVHPLVLGSGRRLFPNGTPDATLALTSSAAMPNGVLTATYHSASVRAPAVPPKPFPAVDTSAPGYAEAVVDYCCQEFLVADHQVLQVYEELLNLARWLRGFAPHNVLEIGTAGGATFFVLSRLATGRKATIDVRDVRRKLHLFMFGHEWCFFHGSSQSDEMQRRVRDFCGSFDLILIDGDHRYAGVKRDFELYRELLSERGVILFHDVDPDHAFKGGAGGDVARFWSELDEGTKTMLCCTRSNGRVDCWGRTSGFGGIGIWSPR